MTQNYDDLLLGLDEGIGELSLYAQDAAAAIRTLQADRDAAYNQGIEDAANVVNDEIPATQEYSQRFSILSSAEAAIRELKRPTP